MGPSSHGSNDIDSFPESLDVHVLFFVVVLVCRDHAVEDEIVTVECNKRGAVVAPELSKYHC
ncbi:MULTISPECIES: hypothetical protein [Haloferax]|uniref:hypothetical protein n=1 Tax=Haloferax TaxID=2251 RepID=UPI000678B037|nr:hypothetical protein [Haloferax mediterranei]MDX5990281.1 hypothetical protein [Haloferax mediterranei ATCC 33500]